MPACSLDVTRIGPKLYQGSLPKPGHDVRRCGFDVLVLSAEEWQPSAETYPGVEVMHVPLTDMGEPLSRRAWLRALRAGQQIAQRLLEGKRVLTTCHAGLNRSGLLNVLAMYYLTGSPGSMLVRHVQSLRPGALGNPYFVRAAQHLPAR